MDLVGSLLRLRAPRAADAEELVAIARDPAVARFARLPRLVPDALPRAREALAARPADAVRWVAESGADGATLGLVALLRVDHRNRNAWLELELGPPARWGRGFGAEAVLLVTRFAFRQLGLQKVYAAVAEGDERGLRLARRAGYAVEAELRRHRLLDGDLVTERWLAAHRSEPPYG